MRNMKESRLRRSSRQLTLIQKRRGEKKMERKKNFKRS